MAIPDFMKERIDYVAEYVGTATNDWLRVKMEIVRTLPVGKNNVGFGRRHSHTLKTIINSFDNEVMNYWYSITGVRLTVDPKKLHNPEWVHRPRGWGLNGGKQRVQQELETQKKTTAANDNKK